jgi:hypothetical protein
MIVEDGDKRKAQVEWPGLFIKRIRPPFVNFYSCLIFGEAKKFRYASHNLESERIISIGNSQPPKRPGGLV